MGQLVFQAALGGAVNLIGPNISATTNFTLPGADGTNGQALTTNGSGTLGFSSIVSGAAGSNTQVQFNNGGNFGASSSLTWSGTILTSTGFAGPLNGTVGATTANTGNFTTLTTSSTVTVNGGTANGVTYLNGSKVLTSGSALTFDGTDFKMPNGGSILIGASASGGSLIAINGTAAAQRVVIGTSGTDGVINVSRTSGTSPNLIFQQESTEVMRLTSTSLYTASGINVGIGTSSPAARLDVISPSASDGIPAAIFRAPTGVGNAGGAAFYANSTDTNARNWYLCANVESYGDFIIKVGTSQGSNPTAGTAVAKFSSAGNLGLGVTPSAWRSDAQAIQNGGGAIFNYNDDRIFLGQNSYIDSGAADKFIANGYATRYRQYQGTHAFYVSTVSNSSGAGASQSLTQAMTLTEGGSLLVGTTTEFAKLSVIVPNGADRNLIQAGVTSATNGLTVKWNNATSTLRVNIQNLPTSATGLASGDLYVLAGVLMVA